MTAEVGAAISRLVEERRWLEKAYDLTDIEAMHADTYTAAILSAQRARLAQEIFEISEALDILNTAASYRRPPRRRRAA
jgi:hypothetical protein